LPNYTYATLSDAQTALAARLLDATNQQWNLAELQAYIIMALRMWNSLTSFWRAEFPLTLSQGVNWYDLTSQSNSLRPFTVTDQSLANLIEYSLLEPLTSLTPTPLVPATWTGSKQFALDNIYGAITRRQNQVLGATGCTLSRFLVNAPIVRAGIVLPDTTIDVRRVAWLPTAGSSATFTGTVPGPFVIIAGVNTQLFLTADTGPKYVIDFIPGTYSASQIAEVINAVVAGMTASATEDNRVVVQSNSRGTSSSLATEPGELSETINSTIGFPILATTVYGTGGPFDTQIMRQTDAWSKRAFDYNYTTKAEQPPQTWMQSTEPPPRFDVDNVPPVTGNYEVIAVNSGAVSNAISAQLLSVPDDWSWLVFFGALADLFGFESEAKDELRAQYCQQRYEQGLKLLAGASSVLSMQFNGLPMSVDAVKNGDNFNFAWESLTQGTPQSCYAAGLNLLAFPTPDSGVYGALPTVVQSAPLPAASGGYIQIARGDYDAMLDEAQHLAALKQGGAEFLRTIPLHQNFVIRAGLYNKKLAAMGPFQMPTYRLSQREEDRNPRVGK
jgi:hypothetical protein